MNQSSVKEYQDYNIKMSQYYFHFEFIVSSYGINNEISSPSISFTNEKCKLDIIKYGLSCLVTKCSKCKIRGHSITTWTRRGG